MAERFWNYIESLHWIPAFKPGPMQAILRGISRTALANALANNLPLPLTSFKVGDGDGAVVTPAASATDVVNACYTGTPVRISVPNSANNQVSIECVVPASSGGYIVREIGLFSGTTLLCYGSTPEIEKPLIESGAVGDLVLTVTMSISNASAVTLEVDPGVAVATRQYVDIVKRSCDTALNNAIAEAQNRETVLRKLLAYYDGLHIEERMGRLRTIKNAPSGMKFNGVAYGEADNDTYICVSYANNDRTSGGVECAVLSDFGFDSVISGAPCYGACYGNGLFLVGGNSKIYYSGDNPWSWHDYPLNINSIVKKIVYTGKFFLAITEEALLKITIDGDDITVESLWIYDVEPLDIAVDPNTGDAALVGITRDNSSAWNNYIPVDKRGEVGSCFGTDQISVEHVFYSEPCQRFVVWGSGGARARHPQGWTTLKDGNILGGGVNVISYSQYIGSGTGGSTLAYFYKTLRRTISESSASSETQTTNSTLAQSQLLILDGLLFAMSNGTIQAE